MFDWIFGKQRMAVGAVAAVVIFGFVWAYARAGSRGPENPPAPSMPIGEEEFLDLEPLPEGGLTLLFCGVDDTQMLTDVVILAQYNPGEGRLSALQIPRDTFVGTQYPTGKLNSVYGHPVGTDGGMAELKTVVEEALAIPIDYTAAVTLEGVRDIVDAFGGVEVDLPQRIEYLPGKVLEEGRQLLDGEKAEWFLRYRKGYATGDIGRLGAQELFLKAALRTAKDQGRLATLRILAANYGAVTTDLPVGQILSLANSLFTAEQELTTQVFLLPGNGVMYGRNAVWEADREKAAEILNLHFRTEEEAVPPQRLGLPPVPQPPPSPPTAPSSGEPPQPGGSQEEFGGFPEGGGLRLPSLPAIESLPDGVVPQG